MLSVAESDLASGLWEVQTKWSWADLMDALAWMNTRSEVLERADDRRKTEAIMRQHTRGR